MSGLDSDWMWLGGSDAATEGTWEWSDGSTFSYTNWAPEQPDNQQGIFGIYGDQDCLFTNFGEAGKWDDLSCLYGHNDLLKFVCEIDTGTAIADIPITKDL